MLYDRDYNLGLTSDELEKYKELTGNDFNIIEHSKHSKFGVVNRWNEYPVAARLYKTLFPNYFIDNVELHESEILQNKNDDFLTFLNKCNNEREILNFIKNKKYYHIIGSLLRGMQLHTGHHGAFVFPEFQLSNKYQADYLIAAKSSGGYEFVLVELENPKGNITLKDGDLGAEFRDGISQIKEWIRWLPQNYSAFSETIKKYKHPLMDLPDEFYTIDLSRFHYAVIAGRRTDYTELTYTIAREIKKSDDVSIFHYDKLYDFANILIGKVTY